LYEIERENIAITDASAVLQQPGDQRSRGVEVEIAAEPAPRLRTLFAYAYNDAELTDFVFIGIDPSTGQPATIDHTGNVPPYAPEHLASLWVSRSFASGFGVAGGGRYFSGQFFSTDNAYEVDDAVVLDAALFYDIAAWRFKVNLKNVTDEEFETGSFGSASVVPGDGFAVFGAAEVRF
jgi:iron complex outermembrane receptor protein